MTEANSSASGSNGKPQAPPFKLERNLVGVAHGFMEISERVVNGTLGTGEAREATRALSGVPLLVRTQLEAIRIFEKGSERARQQAARILEMTAIDSIEPPKAS
jgi:hypothetical protein